MDGKIDAVTLIFLVLAVVVFLKLRSVLGRRTGQEESRIERYRAQREASQRNGKVPAQEKVVTLPRRERDEYETAPMADNSKVRSDEHTSELQSRPHLVCRLLLEKKKNQTH